MQSQINLEETTKVVSGRIYDIGDDYIGILGEGREGLRKISGRLELLADSQISKEELIGLPQKYLDMKVVAVLIQKGPYARTFVKLRPEDGEN